ncbi:MAG: 16S rRNA (cytosine(967)-C(5))-methyltransferase RsmB, partial [Candidatus Abyssubacteria bacterium]|nr:16S rRNA (cytosine(967)-C(5))-methyltransferase RsmB [Candidatus Abyssubacteria bacterium]
MKVLRRTETALSFPKLLIEQSVEKTLAEERQRAFTYQLVMGTLRRRGTLDWALGKVCDVPLDGLTPWIRNILRMGLFQILYLDRVPDYAAVSEAVRMAGSVEKGRWSSSVNAILRRVQSERNNLPWPSRSKNLQRFLRIRYSHPAWLVKVLLREHGPCVTEEILKSNNRRPKLTIRCNTLKVRHVDLRSRLEKEG